MRSMASTVADSGMGSSPSRSPIVGSPHGMSGNAFARFDASRLASNARSMSCITCSESAISSARCSGLRDAMSRLMAAERRAMSSSSSSRLFGSFGMRSP